MHKFHTSETVETFAKIQTHEHYKPEARRSVLIWHRLVYSWTCPVSKSVKHHFHNNKCCGKEAAIPYKNLTFWLFHQFGDQMGLQTKESMIWIIGAFRSFLLYVAHGSVQRIRLVHGPIFQQHDEKFSTCPRSLQVSSTLSVIVTVLLFSSGQALQNIHCKGADHIVTGVLRKNCTIKIFFVCLYV